MKTINVIVYAYVSTMQEIEVADDFDFKDEKEVQKLADSGFIEDCLMDNAEDCIKSNKEVCYIEDSETGDVIYNKENARG